MEKPLDKNIRYGTEFENEDLKTYIDELWQYTDFLENKLSEKFVLTDVVQQSELYTCECKVCGKPFGDKLSLYKHYDEEHN